MERWIGTGLVAVLFGGVGLFILGFNFIVVPHITLLFFGSIFSIVGFMPLTLQIKKHLSVKRAVQNSHPIQAHYHSVIYRNGYCILCQWHDEASNQVFQFYSDPFKMDPTDALKGTELITVLINPDDPKDYYIDIKMIPELQTLLKYQKYG